MYRCLYYVTRGDCEFVFRECMYLSIYFTNYEKQVIETISVLSDCLAIHSAIRENCSSLKSIGLYLG